MFSSKPISCCEDIKLQDDCHMFTQHDGQMFDSVLKGKNELNGRMSKHEGDLQAYTDHSNHLLMWRLKWFKYSLLDFSHTKILSYAL